MHAEERARSTEAREDRAPARQPRVASPSPDLLALQGTVGNAAVVQLLHRAGHPGAGEQHRHTPAHVVPRGPAQRVGGGPESVQRSIHSYPTSGEAPDEQVAKDLAAFSQKLDAAVQSAWLQATQDPTDANLARTDGYVGRWAEQWQEYLGATPARKAEIAALVPAMAGYAIESLATKVFLTERTSWTGPDSGLTFSVAMQVTHGSTRPDVVLRLDGSEVAWYDITSAARLEHIFDKVGSGWSTRPYVAEIAYPRVTAQTVESNAAKWEAAGRPAITNDPMIFANYWVERGRFEMTLELVRQDILRASPSLLDHARKAADNVTGNVNHERRRQYMRACLALYKAGKLGGDSSESDVADAVRARVGSPGDEALEPLPKETASVVQWLTDNHKKYGFQGSDGKSSFKSLSVQPGIVWLQECAAHKQLTVSDAEVLTYLRTNYPEGVDALRNAGLVT